MWAVEMIAPVVSESRVLSLTRIQRQRLLPLSGEVMVTVGTRVDGNEIIARANAIERLRPIPLARYMRLNEAALQKHLLKLPGEYVQSRDIIASKPEYLGTLRRIYRAPGNGRFASLQGTWITLDLSDEPFRLRALYRGAVTNVVPRRGVVIEAVGALAQGTWGVGEAYGVLKPMVDTANSILMEEKIDIAVRGAVLLAGSGITNASIQRAVQEQAAGLIVGSLRAAQRELVIEQHFPTLITEGFGDRAMATHTFQLLTSHAEEEIALNASMPAHAMRPEVFIPAKPTSGGAVVGLPPSLLTLQVGARVRVIAEPHPGEFGKISALISTPQVLESGLSAGGAEIELASGERFFVPWENFELIDG